jgi:hypothetical protein
VAGIEMGSVDRRGFSVVSHDIPMGQAGRSCRLDVSPPFRSADLAYLLCFSVQAEREEILAAKKIGLPERPFG